MSQRHGTDREAPPDSLCDTCCDLNMIHSMFSLDPEDARSSLLEIGAHGGWKNRKLEYLDDIYRRRDQCSFCWLIFHATNTSDEDCAIRYDGLTKDGQRIQCRVDWFSDGKVLPQDEYSAYTCRLKVHDDEETFPGAYIMLMCGDVPEECAEPCFLGREIPRHHVSLDMVRNWLHLCREHHGETCEPRSARPQYRSITPSRLRLVDLQENCLVTFEPLGDVGYATLSYVWGRTPVTRLERDILEKFSSPGGLDPNVSSLPDTIRDAMLLVRSLEIRYLWVDSLCIIQDDREDWAYVAPLMDRIYGNGIVNICAAAGDDAHYGLPGTQLTRRNAVQPFVSVSGMTLLAAKEVESLIQNTKWSTRAWTFQERLLSRRSLIFTADRVFFQCHQATWSEEVHSESDLSLHTVDNEFSPLSPIRYVKKHPIALFVDYVRLYSNRKLTIEGDCLAAFAGLSSVLCPPLRAHLLYGLPNSYFDIALLWEINQAGEYRDLRQFPSWSWCGWKGAVIWRFSLVHGPKKYDDLHKWLTNHTWVVWYIYLDPGADLVAGAISPSEGVDVSMPGLRLVWQEAESPSRGPDKRQSSASNMPYGRSPRPGNDERPTYPTSTELHNGWLYFWTYTAFFQLSMRSKSTPESSPKLEPGLHRFGIVDDKGNPCGVIVLPTSWSSRIGDTLEFAAISEAEFFGLFEVDDWWNDIYCEGQQSYGFIYYALLIVWDDDHRSARRAGLAKIHKKAFETGSFEPEQKWREIVLA